MYVSLHSTRAQRFANSLAAGVPERIPGGGQLVPLRSSRWVSGNWALKSGLACLECPLGPGLAPQPGELAQAERLHSSTGCPDSRATLQTSLRPRLRATTACGCRAPSPVPDSHTCLFQDYSLLGNFVTSKLLAAEGRGQRPPGARAGFGFSAAKSAVNVALDERRSLLFWPHELKFRAHWAPGVLETGIRGSLRGPRNDVRGRHIFSGSWLRRGGGELFLGPGDSAAPPHERQERISRGKFGSEARAEAAAQDEHGGCSRKGARAAARRQAGWVEGPEPASGTARSACLLPPSRGDAAFGLRGSRNTPLSPPPRRRALRRSRALGGVPLSAPAAALSLGACFSRALQGAGAPSPREKRRPGSRFRTQGLAGGRPRAADQPEPPTASLAAAATAASAVCSAVAAMPAAAGEVRGAFPEVGFSGDAWGNLGFCCP